VDERSFKSGRIDDNVWNAGYRDAYYPASAGYPVNEVEVLMKEILQNLAFFIVFCIVFSGLSACTGTSGPANNAAANTTARANANTAAPGNSATSSVYPPLTSSIAQADLELIDGTTTKVDDRKGKVILLNLWGIWCGPCRSEMPHLVEMQNTYRDKGFEVIGLNIGDEEFQPENIDAIKSFSSEMKLNYELARIPNSMTKDFNRLAKFDGVPLSVLVDREGHLRGIFQGPLITFTFSRRPLAGRGSS
jgi:thiol-disulfide isomerase/thioredoxin